MVILSKEKISDCLWQYYVQNYGKDDSDIWYDQPAANVWMFGRNGKILTLKCHVLTGVVTEHIEEIST